MYNFIFQLIIFVSLGVIIYLFARALPRVENENVSSRQLPLLDSFLSARILDRADNIAKTILEKILRRIKIIVMKVDNFVSEHLGKLKKGDKEIQHK